MDHQKTSVRFGYNDNILIKKNTLKNIVRNMAAILLMYTANNSSAGIQPRPWDETHGQPAGKCGNQTVIANCDGVRLDTNHSQGVELYHSSV